MEQVNETAFVQLLDTIYQAALTPELWSQLVNQISLLMAGTMVVLQAHDLVQNSHLGEISSPVDPDLMTKYSEHFAAKNIWVPAIASMTVGIAGHPEDMVPTDDLLKSEFYNDFLKPLGGYSTASGIVVHREQDRFLVLSGNISQKNADALRTPLRLLLDRLAPHIARAFALMRTLPLRDAQNQYPLTDALVDNPVVFLTAAGKIVHANSAAEILLRHRTLLGATAGGGVFLTDAAANERLMAALHVIASGRYTNLKGHFRVAGESEVRDVHIVPLARTAHLAGPIGSIFSNGLPLAVLAVGPAQRKGGPLATAPFGLTRAEIALASALTQGVSLNDYAESNHLSRHTVRNQLQSIYSKTDTHRQSQLVAFLLRNPPA
ncbi:MAG: helix-turn-helix transcriptional regulator [Alphaproteobacteria bacterium]|nr:helix-turn-helix transcriptional regulator [Alphaproteobacteria bacterium]